eukprot:CAMPEP_0202962516 /NCGR_PEP_ID=MMETSP1396-20130829/6624_1 /ASSEMBLY_ACC=CAM_ASM_000872 /TAXON_ID= /ORGANISM="Pseudokeronopsis sp., Strain Brazil" /LENGTH=131 /DNA_ID=CAMNT_0049683161 /DNA_START=394 /DNA_END=793 /DNA_ORIENTATION=-
MPGEIHGEPEAATSCKIFEDKNSFGLEVSKLKGIMSTTTVHSHNEASTDEHHHSREIEANEDVLTLDPITESTSPKSPRNGEGDSLNYSKLRKKTMLSYSPTSNPSKARTYQTLEGQNTEASQKMEAHGRF